MEKTFKITTDGKYIIDENGNHIATLDPSLKDSGLGYKAAGYTEEDMRKAFFNGGINLASDEDDEKQFKDFLKSLKKTP